MHNLHSLICNPTPQRCHFVRGFRGTLVTDQLFAQLVDRLRCVHIPASYYFYFVQTNVVSIRRFNLVVVVCPYRPSSRNAPWCGCVNKNERVHRSAPQVAAPRLLVSSSNLTPHACEGHGNLRALFSNEGAQRFQLIASDPLTLTFGLRCIALILSIFVLPASLGYWDVSPPFHFFSSYLSRCRCTVVLLF